MEKILRKQKEEKCPYYYNNSNLEQLKRAGYSKIFESNN